MKNLRPIVRAFLFPVAATLALASVAFADDKMETKNNNETTHDVSKNPITGTTTETTTTEKDVKVGDASKTMKITRKKKTSRDGKKVKETVDAASEAKHE